MTTEYKKLRRQNGIIGGVCGGLAEFTGVHVFFWRLLFLFLLLPGGLPGFLPYIFMWIAIPKKRYPAPPATYPQIEARPNQQSQQKQLR
ncbi:MAG TPA: PspC domain-containing protein [Caldilineae bacterium]|nr:PspC domain-containing protein [Caldilineae bacterium]